MTRQMDKDHEDRQNRLHKQTLHAVNGGLAGSVAHAGGVLGGFSARLSNYECLLVLRATFPAGPMVAFAGGEDLAGALRKAVREANTDSLRWRSDRYAKE